MCGLKPRPPPGPTLAPVAESGGEMGRGEARYGNPTGAPTAAKSRFGERGERTRAAFSPAGSSATSRLLRVQTAAVRRKFGATLALVSQYQDRLLQMRSTRDEAVAEAAEARGEASHAADRAARAEDSASALASQARISSSRARPKVSFACQCACLLQALGFPSACCRCRIWSRLFWRRKGRLRGKPSADGPASSRHSDPRPLLAQEVLRRRRWRWLRLEKLRLTILGVHLL